MKTLKSLFRRGQGPPSASGARNTKRGGSSNGDQLSVGPPSLNGASNAALGPLASGGDMVASRSAFGSADLPKQVDPTCDGPIGSLKTAASVSSLDSKHHKVPLPKQLRSSRSSTGEKPRPPGLPDTTGGALQTVTNNNNNNNHNRRKTSVITMDSEVTALLGELEKVSKDKDELIAKVAELSSQQSELEALREEVNRLRENCKMEVEQSLPARQAQNPALSDSEKEQMLMISCQTHSQNSVMNDITANTTTTVSQAGSASAGSDRELLDATCVTPERDRDWDKLSCSSLSEVSVACLQDRIMQMEETHYSTNEELQATLQELADLQAQLTELQADNERLTEEKSVLLESLCRQTEKLEDSRTKVDTLQDLLLRDGQPDESGTPLPEREQKLVELLKSGQEEREALLLKQEELSTEVVELHTAAETHASECTRLAERVRLLESTVDATHAERKQLDQELALAKEESSSRHIEISRLSTLLENARAKIEELEQTRELGDRTEVEARLDTVRREKDVLEGQVASLQEQLSRSQCEVTKLREQLSTLQEECKVMRNNAKSARSDLEYQCEQLRKEKSALTSEVQQLQDSTAQLQLQCQCHLEDKRQLKAALSETQRTSTDLERRLNAVQVELTEEKRLRKEEGVEWQQYQSDLLMTVRVANDFKTEAQHELEKLVLENKTLRDKVRTLETQVEKLKAAQKCPSPTPVHHPPPVLRSVSMSGALVSGSAVEDNVLSEISAVRRAKPSISRQDSRLSVKSLIESIENATKQAKTGPGGSRSSSTSSLSSIASEVRAAAVSTSTPTSPLRHLSLTDSEALFKAPLRDQQQSNNQNNNNNNHHHNNNNLHQNNRLAQQPRKNMPPEGGKPITLTNNDEALGLTNITHHPALTTPVAILTSKSMDYARRNSCGDLSERKDPLAPLVKNGGSKRNALLKWCQNKTVGYRNIDITNFSSSWNDGLAFCAILHSYLPDRVPYETLTPNEKRRNFTIAFAAAESVGITTTLNINDMIQLERPDWQQIMAYVTAIYVHFET